MMKIATWIFSCLLAFQAFSQTDTLQHRIFLVGDAGELHGGHQPIIDWLKKNVDWDDPRNIVVFLGDNIYEYGLPMEGEADYQRAKQVIDYQIGLVKGKKARAIFVPGNHDWNNGKMGGWQRVMNQVDYINGLGEKNIEAWPHGGCPGPILVDLSEKVALTIVDSQWFLYVHDKPGPGSGCNARTIDEFENQLKEIVATRQNQLLIVAMHHPLYSFGPHGGYTYTWKEHIFPLTAARRNLYIPLPIIGSIYPIARGVFGSLQDVKHPLYQTMSEIIEKTMKLHPNPVHVAGHDHSLQMIMKDSIPYIVSGSAAKLNRIEEKPPVRLLFSDINYGFATLEITRSGRVETKFYTINNSSLKDAAFRLELKKIDSVHQPITKYTIPQLPDSVKVAANPKLTAGAFKKFLFGENYRQEWTTPITVPVLDIGKELGGLTPQREGGGRQTRSLRVVDTSGKEWVLRTVQKFPDAAIPADLRQTMVRDMVEDGVSAAYPYAALSVPVLAQAAGVPYLKRKVVYVPDDPRLGRFRSSFKNTLVTLEEREPDTIDKTDNTEEIVLKLFKDNDHRIDQLGLLKARLLDNFYMDFDRHDDQWRWAERDTGKGKTFYAIPRDQDQAFFVNEGFIPTWINRFSIIPELQGFKSAARNIKTFNKPARNFDRFFLTQLDEATWNREVDSFLTRMTDQVLAGALQQQPREIQGYHAGEIIEKLKQRRQYFKKEMMTYYRFLSKEVNITGSNQRELFLVEKKDDGSVMVTVQKIDRQNQLAAVMYQRSFDPAVTKELRLFGLQDADSFVLKGGRTPIKIRLIGGPGIDHFHSESSAGTSVVYDVNFEQTNFSGNQSVFRKHITSNPQENQYVRNYFKYDVFSPGISAAWNVDDGLFLGAALEVEKQGFRKEPYAMRHFLKVNHALRTASWRFRYEGDFTKIWRKYDLVVRTDVRAPVNVTNFFGLGNNTAYDKTKPGGEQYYRARYNIANASFLLKRQLQSWMRVNYGPTLQYFHLEQHENEGRFVSDAPANGLNPEGLYDRRWYAGLEGNLELNSRNNQVIPTRGFQLNAGLRSLLGLNNHSNNLAQFNWDMNVAASFGPKAITVFALRFGYATNFGDFEFPQAQYLSGTENLRGYRRNRFAGRSMLFQNTEVRVKLADFTTYLFPGSVGVLAFHDIGRVWMDNEQSRRWHNGYGAGIWLSPIKRFVLTGSLVYSKEEKGLPYFTFGFQF